MQFYRNNIYGKIFAIFSILFLVSLGLSIWMGNMLFVLLPFGAAALFALWSEHRLLFFLLLFSLPISTELQVSSEFATDFPDELLMLFTTGVLAAIFVYRGYSKFRDLLAHPLMVLVILSLVWTIVSITTSDDLLISVKYFLAKTWYLAAFVIFPFLILRKKEDYILAIRVLCFTMLTLVLIIMTRHMLDSFSFTGINDAVKPFFRNHVNYSAMLVCFIPLAVILYQRSQTGFDRKLSVLILFIFFVALFFSYARGAWLALITGAVAFYLIKRRLLLISFIAFVIIVIGAIGWLDNEKRYLKYAHDFRSTIYHENIREHLQATYQGKDVSTAERFYRWIAGVRMIQERPLTGFGPNTFYNNYKSYTIPAYKTWVSKNEEKSTVHNYFLLLAIEQGILGLLLFLLLTCGMIYYCERLYAKARDPFNRNIAHCVGVILVMILTVNFLSDLIETDKIGSIFFLCLSALIISDLRERSKFFPSHSMRPEDHFQED